MPSKVRIITRKSKEEIDMDRVSLKVIQQLWDSGAKDQDVEHWGIADYETADAVRRSYRRVGRKVQPEAIAVRSFWKECSGCEKGGPNCRFHCVFSLHSMADARAFMEQRRLNSARRGPN